VKCLFVLFLVLFALAQNKLCAQNSTCVDCSNNNVKIGYNNSINNAYQFQSILGNGNTTLRNNAVAIGSESFARHSHSYVIGSNSESNGIKSFVAGNNSIAGSTYSFVVGDYSQALYGNDFAIGNFVKTGATGGFVLGLGISLTEPLVNPSKNSLAIGMKSTKPTLFISESTASSANNLTGRIGIGNVTDPQAKLHIRADEGEDANLLLEPTDPRRNKAMLQMMDANTGLTAGINTGLQLYTDLGLMKFSADLFNFEGSVKVAGLTVNNAYSLPTAAGTSDQFLRADGTWAVPSGGGGGSSYWLPSGSTIYYNGGNVGIGTNDTKGYKLGVNGKIVATEVVVKYYNQWPDYVFEPTYPLMPLSELQQFVQTHQHLPDMPPAQQVAETGMPVGEMNALLLKKVEELTLYVLQQEEAMKQQQKNMEQQQKEIELLKQKLQD